LSRWLWALLGISLVIAIPTFMVYTVRGWWSGEPRESHFLGKWHRLFTTVLAVVMTIVVVLALLSNIWLNWL